MTLPLRFYHIAFCAALALIPVSPAIAAPPPPADIFVPCTGENYIDILKRTDPALHEKLLATEATVENGVGRLWKVEKEGVEPSYLFGTIHYADQRLSDLPDALDDVIAQSRVVMPELTEVADRGRSAAAMAKVAQMVVLPDGETLPGIMGQADFAETAEKLARRGFLLHGYLKMKPWMVAITASMPGCEIAMQAVATPPLDARVLNLAHAAGAEWKALESLPEQLQLFNELPREAQVRMLENVACIGVHINDMHEAMLQAYREGRIGLIRSMGELLFRTPGDEVEHRFVLEQVLQRRNAVMFERSLPEVTRGRALVAVGAAHLVGKTGLVARYREAGFLVTLEMK